MWLIYAVSAAVVWGLDYSLGERVLKSKISPTTLMIFQMAFGTIFFLVIGGRTSFKHDFQFILGNQKSLCLMIATVVCFNLGNWLIFLSIEAKNATIAGLIELCYPIFTVFFTYFLFRENHLTPNVLLGGVFILLGIIIIGFWN